MEKISITHFKTMSIEQQVDTLRNWIFVRVKLQSLNPRNAMVIDKIVLEHYFNNKDLTVLAHNIGYFNEVEE